MGQKNKIRFPEHHILHQTMSQFHWIAERGAGPSHSIRVGTVGQNNLMAQFSEIGIEQRK